MHLVSMRCTIANSDWLILRPKSMGWPIYDSAHYAHVLTGAGLSSLCSRDGTEGVGVVEGA